jgi:hypothetical protein
LIGNRNAPHIRARRRQLLMHHALTHPNRRMAGTFRRLMRMENKVAGGVSRECPIITNYRLPKCKQPWLTLRFKKPFDLICGVSRICW